MFILFSLTNYYYKMQKKDNYNTRIIIATLLSTILMVAWIKYYGKKTLPDTTKKVEQKIQQEQVLEKKQEVVAEKKIEQKNTISLSEKIVKIDTKKLNGSINLRGLTLDNLILKDYNKNIGSDEKVQLLSPYDTNSSYFVELGWKSEDSSLDLPSINTLWTTDSEILSVNNPVTLSYKNKQGLVFNVVISIDKDYMFSFKQEVINNTKNTVVVQISNKISKKLSTNTETATGVHEGFIGSFGKEIEEIKYKKIKNKNYNFDGSVNWAGFTDKYWLVSMATEKNKSTPLNVSTNHKDGDYIISFTSSNTIVNSGQKSETTNILFTGPKILNLLDQYAFQYDLSLFDRSVDFGWFYFLTKPIYIVLKTFYNFIGNFGVAILLLTFLVKSIMYPFTKKSFVSMAKMKSAQPKIDALKDRFKDDKIKMNRELIELYKRENISPLSGCLPMLVQIPVFFSLYKVLAISIDMRHAPFFGYIKNLADKDPTTIWNLFGLLPYHVNFLHIGLLPCLMSLTMWIQQKMTAQAGGNNPETQMVTKLMPIIFLLLFAGMPAGLLVYWTFSNIISVAQQYYVERKLSKTK